MQPDGPPYHQDESFVPGSRYGNFFMTGVVDVQSHDGRFSILEPTDAVLRECLSQTRLALL